MRGDVSAEPAAIGFSLGGVARWGANASVVAPLRCFLLPCPTQGRLAHRANLPPNPPLPRGRTAGPRLKSGLIPMLPMPPIRPAARAAAFQPTLQRHVPQQRVV